MPGLCARAFAVLIIVPMGLMRLMRLMRPMGHIRPMRPIRPMGLHQSMWNISGSGMLTGELSGLVTMMSAI